MRQNRPGGGFEWLVELPDPPASEERVRDTPCREELILQLRGEIAYLRDALRREQDVSRTLFEGVARRGPG